MPRKLDPDIVTSISPLTCELFGVIDVIMGGAIAGGGGPKTLIFAEPATWAWSTTKSPLLVEKTEFPTL